jgi:hypothetical protein
MRGRIVAERRILCGGIFCPLYLDGAAAEFDEGPSNRRSEDRSLRKDHRPAAETAFYDNVTVVPEPSAAISVIGGIATPLSVRRRRKPLAA